MGLLTFRPSFVMGALGGSLGASLRAPSAGAQFTLDTLTPADIATITGQSEPTWMWLGKNASGADDLVGTDDLSDRGTPTKEVADAILGGTTTTFVNASADGLLSADGTVGDCGVETVTVMHIFRFTGVPSNNTNIVGNRDNTAGNIGYEILSTTTGRILWRHAEASGATTHTIAVDHGSTNAQVIVGTRSITNNISGMWSREGSSTGADGFGETLTNGETFGISKTDLRTAAPQSWGATMVWVGATGDFGNAAAMEAARSAVAVALGYE